MAEIVAIDGGRPGARDGVPRSARKPATTAQGTFAFASKNADAEARERALDVGRSWVVEAPAGSGKTGLLIQRYLKVLGSGDVTSPDQVLAITFTRSATEEIRERIVQALEAAARGTPVEGAFEAEMRSLATAALARDRALGWGLIEDSQQLRVRTIDSVCGEIARLLPVMSGGGGAAAPVDEAQALFRQAARRTLLQLGGEDRALSEALETVLLHREGDLVGCEELLAEMLAAREQWGGLLPIGRGRLTEEALETEVRPRLDRALEQAVCAGLTSAAQALPAGLLEEITEVAAEMSARPGYKGAASPLACCQGRQAPQAIAAHLEQWRALAGLLITNEGGWRKPKGLQGQHLRFEILDSDKARLQRLLDDLQGTHEAREAFCVVASLPPARYPAEQWAIAKALFFVLQRALVELKLVFAETGECDFAEPALLARTALAQGEGAQAYEAALGAELRHLLVDEMQDTSTGQYELLELLTRGWAGDGRTVFLVGDPKQSIYLFRQARVERFVRTMRERQLGELALGCLQLSANFRSQAGLVDDFNRDFERIFPQRSTRDDQIAYTPAQGVREASSGPRTGATWHAAVVSGNDTERSAAKRAIARESALEIRRIISERRRQPLPEGRVEPWKIAVLVASRRELKPVAAALRRDDGDGPIPFRAVNVEPLGEQPEVLDLLALTRAIGHRADRVAWWSVLRAPWCGLELGDLHVLAGKDDAEYRQRTVLELMRQRAHLLSADGRARLEQVAEVLRSALAQAERLPLPELVERTWRALGGDTYLEGPAQSNAAEFFRLLDEVVAQEGVLETGALERRIRKLYAASSMVEGAVELTTIHGAKGLEWDVVLIPELERQAPPSRARLLEWEEIRTGDDEAAGAVLAPIRSTGGEAGALNTWLNSLRAERLAAERRRQFYVACTRAREELHLFGTAELDKHGVVKTPRLSLLAAAWPAAREHFEQLESVLIAGADRIAAKLLRHAGSGAGRGFALAAAASVGGDVPPEGAVTGAEVATAASLVARLSLSNMQELGKAAAGLLAAPAAGGRRAFARPEGSFLARSLGNAVHAFLELAAGRLASGRAPEDLVRELPRWRERIGAVLRADGLAPAEIARLGNDVERAVRQTLESTTGQWLLGARADARSEYALTTAQGGSARVRLDRTFRAGATPEAPGDSHLWIVDYKTGSHAAAGLGDWLEGERQRYLGQMAAYAGVFAGERVNLALWYPMVARLVWWPAREENGAVGTG